MLHEFVYQVSWSGWSQATVLLLDVDSKVGINQCVCYVPVRVVTLYLIYIDTNETMLEYASGASYAQDARTAAPLFMEEPNI